jgi:diaminohydroxyphosphoribosylaminopyrimidine deaminase/5-amino-6-(5-phosphoribosylamino)uracil reductase
VSGEDLFWMKMALAEAEKGRGAVEPNPMVGAVVVREGRALGQGHHARFGGPHAEVAALDQAAENARGATLYDTLEPCCHHGKTPPCTDAVLASVVRRVVAAMRDPFPRVNGGGLAILRAAGILVEVGPEPATVLAAELNAPYLKRLATNLPYVIAKWAMTLDGKTATSRGRSKWISCEESRALVHQIRGRMDAIAVGVGTALADDPELTARPAGPRTALRVVLDGMASLPTASHLVQSARVVPVLIAVTETAPLDRRRDLERYGCEILVLPGESKVPIEPLLSALGDRSMTNVLVEGGGRVLGAFLDAGQVDEIDVFVAPILEGGDHANTALRGAGCESMSEALRLARVVYSQAGVDLRVQGVLPRPWRSITASMGPDHDQDTLRP